jgi:menaquinone-specific isochorismate synthase
VSELAPGPSDAPTVVVRTTRIPDPGGLLAVLPKTDPMAWVRRSEGIVGWGAATRIDTSGPTRFADADAWWRELAARTVVRDEVGLPGSGLVAFGSFGFADDPGDSALIVPDVVVGHRIVDDESIWWVTTVGVGALAATPSIVRRPSPLPPEDLTYTDGATSGSAWAHQVRVREAVRRIATTPLEKVVLARDLVATATEPIDVRWPLHRLAVAYRSCWTYHVDGLLGATPELLVRRERDLVTSRVLAGTIQITGDDTHDLAQAGALARSSKDLEEHEYAVRSVAHALAPHCRSMNVPETPFVLHLPNVMHLATDVTGVIDQQDRIGGDSASSLALAAALHPSAAVGGTPTSLAVEAIADLEGMARGRYTGPVGWIDAAGDGEWGIALRCAEMSGSQVRLFAGGGIVAGSDPEAELAETQAKFVPMRDALGR